MAHGGRPGQTPLAHGNLQPDEGNAAAVAVAENLLAEAEQAVLGDQSLNEEARRAAGRAINSLTRRQRDLEKINDLALGGFEGPDYEMFAGELAAYGYTILASWMRRGLIYQHCADRGRPVGATEAERGELASDPDQCEELAMETAAVSLTFSGTASCCGSAGTSRPARPSPPTLSAHACCSSPESSAGGGENGSAGATAWPRWPSTSGSTAVWAVTPARTRRT